MLYTGSECFDMRFNSVGMWGKATYFSVNASYSNAYAHPMATGSKQIFCANVIIGESFNTAANNSLVTPPLIPGTNKMYDSVTGSTGGSIVYMIYADKKAYPEYLITYKG